MNTDSNLTDILKPATIYFNSETFHKLLEHNLHFQEYLSEPKITVMDNIKYFNAQSLNFWLKMWNIQKDVREDFIETIYGQNAIRTKPLYVMSGLLKTTNAMDEFRTRLITNSLPFGLVHVGSYDERYILSSSKQ